MNFHGKALRTGLCMALAGGLLAVGPGVIAKENDFPSKPIVLVVPFTPGAGTDVSARRLSKTMSEVTGQPVVVENRPGGNNAIGVRHVINAAPDGYTLLVGTNSPVAGNVALFKSLPYDPVEELTPVAPLSRQEWIVAVDKASPFKTLEDLIAAGRKDPLLLTAGAGAAGYQLAAMLLAKNAGVEVNVIPYPGTPQAIQDLMGGRLSFSIVDAGSVLPHLNQGNLRALAEERISVLPDVPTLQELGLPSIPLTSWAGIFAPKGTPQDVLDKLASLIEASLSKEDLRAYYASIGADILTGGASVLKDIQHSDIETYREAMARTGLPPL